MGLILQSAFAFSARIENGELCLDVEEKFDLFAFMNRNLEKEIVNKGAYLLGLAVRVLHIHFTSICEFFFINWLVLLCLVNLQTRPLFELALNG